MNKKVMNKIKETLLAQKAFIMSKAMQDRDIDADGDETDEIQANLLNSINNQLGSRDQMTLKQIEDALKRIEANSYGLCEDCEEPIFEKRLLANPYCSTCIICAESRENEAKQRKRA